MKSTKIILLIVLFGIGLGACQDFLNPTKDNQYTKDRFTNDPAFAYGMLINAYTSGTFSTAYPFDEVATDDAVTNDPTNGYLRLATGEWSALYDPTSVWSGAYGAIINMNYFLSIVNTVQWSWQDTVKNRLFRQRYTGEAMAFRGYYTLKLLQRNGGIASDGSMLGVPIDSTLITYQDDWKLPRPSFQATVKNISRDFEAALKLMPYRYSDISNATAPADIAWNKVNGAGINKNLIDGRAVLGLKSRLYILAASPAFNDGVNYNLVMADSAAQISGRMIKNNGGFAASVYPDPVFWDADADQTNGEIIWRNDVLTNNTLEGNNYPPKLFGSGRINPTQNLVDAFPMANGYPITDGTSGYDPQNPYTNRDPRLKKFILVNGMTVRSTVINTAADSPTNDGINKLSTYSTRTGYYLLKLLRTDVNYDPAARNTKIHFFAHERWTEILLNYAEAANEKYGPDGDAGYGFTPRNVIAAIRKRAGIAQPDNFLATVTSAAAMREVIRNERRLELCFEGFRFWDLRRWKVDLTKLTETAKGVYITTDATTNKLKYDYTIKDVNPVEARAYQTYMYYGPIPYMDTKKYPGILQNQGW